MKEMFVGCGDSLVANLGCLGEYANLSFMVNVIIMQLCKTTHYKHIIYPLNLRS